MSTFDALFCVAHEQHLPLRPRLCFPLAILRVLQSVGAENYGKTIDFLQNVAARFRVGSGADDNQIALVKFAALSTLSFGLDDHHTNSAVASAMGATQYSSSGTIPNGIRCPGYSMKIASDQVICTSCPGRSSRSAPITVVFLTNGNPRYIITVYLLPPYPLLRVPSLLTCVLPSFIHSFIIHPSLIGSCDGANGNQGMDRIAEVHHYCLLTSPVPITSRYFLTNVLVRTSFIHSFIHSFQGRSPQGPRRAHHPRRHRERRLRCVP